MTDEISSVCNIYSCLLFIHFMYLVFADLLLLSTYLYTLEEYVSFLSTVARKERASTTGDTLFY